MWQNFIKMFQSRQIFYNLLTQNCCTWVKVQMLVHAEARCGVSSVDSLIGSPSLIPELRGFFSSRRPISLATNYTYLHFRLDISIMFSQETRCLEGGYFKNVHSRNIYSHVSATCNCILAPLLNRSW